jgi:molybdopterin-guanine dinucleotide biosynthesis protein A
MKWEAVILAGGLSARMGSDKAQLRLGGKTLLAHVKEAAKAAGLPVRVIRRDRVPRCGPLGGIYTALRTTHADVVLFLSCDMPFVTARLLRRVALKLTSKNRAVFMGSEQAGFPFALGRSTIKQVEQQIAARQLSIQRLALALKARRLQISPRERMALFNVNTREDYERARERWTAR